jgi:hypothetical protein
VLLWTVHAAGMVGLLVRSGWRDDRTVYLFGILAAGLGATILLDVPAFSQQWFICSTQVPVAIGAAWGFARLVDSQSFRSVGPILGAAALLGAAAVGAVWATADASGGTAGSPFAQLWRYAGGFLIAVVALVAVGFVLSRMRQPGVSSATVALLFVASALTGLGLFRTTQLVGVMGRVPWQQADYPPSGELSVGNGGITAARWLRDHSDPDDIVATNAHTTTPTSDDILNFWLAAYTERHVLVEGWGYTTRHSARVTASGRPYGEVPFWDQTKLRANDRAFEAPSRQASTDLKKRYGVRWLVLDRRFDANAAELERLSPHVFAAGDYLVFHIASGE